MPRSISVIGWSTILFSIIIILTELFSLLSNPLQEINTMLGMLPQTRISMESVNNMIQYIRIWSIYIILYFFFVLSGAILFVQLKAIGRNILEFACWIGIANACIDTILSYIFWERMQAILSTVMVSIGMSLGQMNPLGIITIILGFFLWIFPSTGMILYLRNPKIKSSMK